MLIGEVRWIAPKEGEGGNSCNIHCVMSSFLTCDGLIPSFSSCLKLLISNFFPFLYVLGGSWLVPREASAGIIHVLYIEDCLMYLCSICSVLLGFLF